MSYFTEGTLSDSFIYSIFNNNKEMSKSIMEAITKGRKLDASYFDEQILQIQRTRLSPLADKVLSAFENGDILFIYAPEIKITQSIPFVVIKLSGRMKGVVFLNNYGDIREGNMVTGGHAFTIQMRDFYVLMESAYIAKSYYEYPARLEKSIGLMRIGAAIYRDMMMRILNREFSVNTDMDLYQQVSFVIAKFFLTVVWTSNPNADLATNYAMSILLNPNKTDLLILNDQYDSAKITSVEELIKFISGMNPKFSDLRIRYFVQSYINTFKPGALLSMDCLPYFIFTLNAAMLKSMIFINQPIMSDIIKNNKNMNVYYSELAKIF